MSRKGTDFEIWIRKQIEKLFGKYDPETKSVVRNTINSGATVGDNDIVLLNIAGMDWQVECKSSSKKLNFIVKKEDWDHLVSQSNQRLREPILFSMNSRGQVIAVTDGILLLELLQTIHKIITSKQ